MQENTLMKIKGPVLLILGAGASVDSGLNAFRNSKNALYENITNPEDTLHFACLSVFKLRQKMFDLLKPIYDDILSCNGKYGQTYDILSKYLKNGCVVNQNIDGLATIAFKDIAKDVIEMHGNWSQFVCMKCNNLQQPNFDASVKCLLCNNIMRPNIVLYGEDIAKESCERFYRYNARNHPQTVLVVGTSMSFLYLRNKVINKAKHHGAKVIHINPDKEYPDKFVRKNELCFKNIEKFNKSFH
ncbi:hypothetical protein OAB94_02495 [Flavobacteriaceae bacterium]|nr:hypothetical protein [Flavobacteriaceae bacterium]